MQMQMQIMVFFFLQITDWVGIELGGNPEGEAETYPSWFLLANLCNNKLGFLRGKTRLSIQPLPSSSSALGTTRGLLFKGLLSL
jgi:hypothetical protein